MPTVVGFDDSLKKKVSCGNCAAIVEYVLNEVSTKRVSCMGDVDIVSYITCPNCLKAISVKSY